MHWYTECWQCHQGRLLTLAEWILVYWIGSTLCLLSYTWSMVAFAFRHAFASWQRSCCYAPPGQFPNPDHSVLGQYTSSTTQPLEQVQCPQIPESHTAGTGQLICQMEVRSRSLLAVSQNQYCLEATPNQAVEGFHDPCFPLPYNIFEQDHRLHLLLLLLHRLRHDGCHRLSVWSQGTSNIL